MDRHSLMSASMERRFSLNSTHMATPIAESTCLGNNTSASKWFGKLSPKISSTQRSNSSICLSNSRSTPTRDQNNTSYMSPTRQKLNLSRIDPRIYADANSSGLVSRVVKYQESDRQLQRSISANNLYNKPGQFPVVHLKKKELPYKASKHNISMTRIAPPDRTVYYGNTLSSLLRSNSIVGVHKTDEELSCENRPILHPPPTENEMAPTRSVLEVLKEISRKRINNNDLQPDEEKKKSCNREFDDFVDSPNTSSSTGTNINTSLSYKRQRDLGHHQQTILPYVPMNVPEGNHHIQKSPEQLAKRRHCSFNNDITSSLSSSLIHTNKRKLLEQKAITNRSQHSTLGITGRNGSNNSSPETEIQAAKIQRKQGDLRFQNVPNSTSLNTPITPLPSTPYNQTLPNNTSYCEKASQNAGVVPQRTVSAPVVTRTHEFASSNVTSKPKLTLFNKDYKQRSDREPYLDNSDLESNECTGINFVKPKKFDSINSGCNPMIERTQKSKLALMLSGLRGEIYQGVELEDELDGNVEKASVNDVSTLKQTNDVASKDKGPAVILNNKPNNLSMKTINDSSQPEINKTATSVTTAPATSVTTSTTNTSNTTTNSMFSPPKSSATQSTLGSVVPTIGFGAVQTLLPQTTTSATTTSSTSTTSGIVTTSATTLDSTAKPTFSFGIGTTLAPATTTASTSATSTLTTIPNGTTSTAPVINFGSNTVKTSEPAVETAKSNTSAFSLTAGKTTAFSFGSTTQATTTAASTSTTTTTFATTAPTFGNASFKNYSTLFASSIKQPDTAIKPFSFGGDGGGDTTAPQSTTTSNNSVPPAKFSFGDVASNTQSTSSITNTTTSFTPSVTAAPTFGSTQSGTPLFGAGSASQANNEPSKTFSFGNANTNTTSTTEAPKTTSQNLFSFAGASSEASKPSATTNSGGFSFAGAAAASTNVNPLATSSTFGSIPPNTNMFTFGGGAQGSNAGTTTPIAATTAATTSTNIFGFGQKPATANSNTMNNNQVKSNSNQVTTATPFTFGSSVGAANNESKKELTGSNSTNMFTFGGGGQSNITQNVITNTKSNSIFGGNVASNTQLPNVNKPAATTTFNFSGSNTTQKPFGSDSTTTAASTSTLNGHLQSNNGTSAATFSFGDQSKKTTAGGFSFGNVSNASAQNVGNTTANASTVPPNTGVVKPNFSFGSALANTNNGNNMVNKTIANGNSTTSFGAITAGASNNTFTFGTSNNANGNAGATAGISGGNIFGNSAAAAKSTPATGGFSFGSKPNGPTAGLGNTTAATTTPFAFGSGAAAATNEPAKTFSFSNVATANASTSSGGNIFGNSQSAKPPAAAFSFGNAVANNPAMAASPQQQQTNNIFSLPQTGQSDRPIRRATRRLQK